MAQRRPSRRAATARSYLPGVCAIAAVLTASMMAVGQDRRQSVVHPTEVRAVGDPPIQWPIYCHLPVSSSVDELPAGAERLLLQFAQRYAAGHYVEAERVAARLVEVIPTRPEGYYNHACALAALRRVDESLDALESAIQYGWRNSVHLRLDGDLDPVRRDPRFERLSQRMEKLIEAERIEPRELRLDSLADIQADLNLHVPAILQRYHVPGVTIALVRNGRVVWTGAYGANQANSGSIMRSELLFSVRRPLELMAMLGALREMDQTTLAWALDVARRRNGSGSRSEGQAGFDGQAAPGTGGREGPVGPFRAALEAANDQGFVGYCQSDLFRRLEMRAARFVIEGAGWHSVAIGHTPLGTPMPILENPSRGNRAFVTAADLGRLVSELVRAEHGASSLEIGGPLFSNLSEDDAAEVAGLIPSLSIVQTAYGARVRMADVPPDRALTMRDPDAAEHQTGSGCLMQWYPRAQCGVVVLFNAEDGLPAAERIAQLAIGGE